MSSPSYISGDSFIANLDLNLKMPVKNFQSIQEAQEALQGLTILNANVVKPAGKIRVKVINKQQSPDVRQSSQLAENSQAEMKQFLDRFNSNNASSPKSSVTKTTTTTTTTATTTTTTTATTTTSSQSTTFIQEQEQKQKDRKVQWVEKFDDTLLKELSQKEIKQRNKYIQRWFPQKTNQINRGLEEAQKTGDPVYISLKIDPKNPKEDIQLLILPNGRIFKCCNKSSAKDNTNNINGFFKQFRMAFDIGAKKTYAWLSMNETGSEHELSGIQLVNAQKVHSVVKTHFAIRYLAKVKSSNKPRPVTKVRILAEYANAGDTLDVIAILKKVTEKTEEIDLIRVKLQMTYQLLKLFSELEQKQILTLDLKLENLLWEKVGKTWKEGFRLKMTDFGAVMKTDDQQIKLPHTTPAYVARETAIEILKQCAEAKDRDNVVLDLTQFATHKQVAYMLGLCLYTLWSGKNVPWFDAMLNPDFSGDIKCAFIRDGALNISDVIDEIEYSEIQAEIAGLSCPYPEYRYYVRDTLQEFITCESYKEAIEAWDKIENK